MTVQEFNGKKIKDGIKPSKVLDSLLGLFNTIEYTEKEVDEFLAKEGYNVKEIENKFSMLSNKAIK